MLDWLPNLQAKRQRFVSSVRENGFEGGVWQSAVEKYADPVHFIFELIQNAEDQEATLARFTLGDNFIILEHNGKPFSQDDVERITGWGQSDKPNQANKIGRFGIGFKSVFVVTDSPEIYVREEADTSIPSFRIRDLFVPEVMEEDPQHSISETHDCATRFVLRFRNTEAQRLSALIREKFESFSADALLFLQTLERVEWSAGPISGVCERFDRDKIRRIRTTLVPTSGSVIQTLKRYLIFDRPILLTGAERRQTVKLAFLLDDEGRIVAEEPKPPLHVFFPTEERPGLHFRLHAPFLLTDNRANIKHGVDENNLLVAECAKLLREAVKDIKERNKLTVSFLNILPFSRSDFRPDSILAPLFDATFTSIYTDRTLPCADDTFCVWNEARFTKDLRLIELVTEKLLTEILGEDQKLRWLHKDFGRTESLPLLDFLETGVAAELRRQNDSGYWTAASVNIVLEWDTVAAGFSQNFLEARNDRWIGDLYCYLDKQEVAQWRLPHGDLRRCPIVRLSTGTHTAAFREDKKPQAFLPSDEAADYPTVKASVLREEAALSFIKKIGITPPDMTARILEVIFPKYSPLVVQRVSLDEHLKDFDVVSSFVKRGSGASFDLVWKALEQTTFFYARNAADTQSCHYQLRKDVYAPTAELEAYFSGNKEGWFLHECYAQWSDILKERLKISEAVRVTFRPATASGEVTVQRRRGHNERGLNRFDPEAEVHGLDHAIRNLNLEKVRVIWNRVLAVYPFLIKGQVESSRYQTYDNAQRTRRFSRFAKRLVEVAWLPKPDGGWEVPKNLSLEDLPELFIRNHEVAAQLGMKQSLITELAAQKKITVRLLQQLLDAAEREPEKLGKILEALVSPPPVEPQAHSESGTDVAGRPRSALERLADAFVARGATALDVEIVPPGTLRNPERYRRELETQLKERKASERPREQRQGVKLRRVWEDAKPEVRQFLLQTYNGRCQITGKTFPKRDGKPYFEVWYLISTTEAEWLDEPGNALCVSPEYWAKLEYGARAADPAAVIDQILRWRPGADGGSEEPILRLKLCGEDVEIRYQEQHMLRLQVLIKGMEAVK